MTRELCPPKSRYCYIIITRQVRTLIIVDFLAVLEMPLCPRRWASINRPPQFQPDALCSRAETYLFITLRNLFFSFLVKRAQQRDMRMRAEL